MKKCYWILIGIFLFSVGFLFAEEQISAKRTPFSQKLEAHIGKDTYVKQNPGMGRLKFMRFYFPNNTVQQEPGFWDRVRQCDDDTLIRAQAIYLYNMYVSAAAYREDVPSQLTVDYLGVLDGFSRCKYSFDSADSASFYRKHKPEIKALLKQFFARHELPEYRTNDLTNDVRELAFLQLLVNMNVKRGTFPGYKATRNTRLVGSFRQQDVAILKQFLQRSLAKGRNKTISYEERQAFGPQWDTPIAHMRTKTTTTCRAINDECAPCSYLFGKEMCTEITAKHRNWGLIRIYQVTATPKHWKLKTASGSEQFTLADGSKASPWSYHVATLVIMNLDGKYTPYIVDKFLAGANPMAPNTWFQKFSLSETSFIIKPFQRNAASEKKLRGK